VLQHGVHEGGLVWHVTSGNIACLDDTIVDDHGKTLATGITENGHSWWSVQHEVKSLGEIALRVRQERDHGAFNALVLGPCLHDCAVVHAIDEHLINALGLQLSLLRQVSRHLLLGSDWGVRTWQAHHNGLLACQALRQIHVLWRKSLVHTYSGELIPDRCKSAGSH